MTVDLNDDQTTAQLPVNVDKDAQQVAGSENGKQLKNGNARKQWHGQRVVTEARRVN